MKTLRHIIYLLGLAAIATSLPVQAATNEEVRIVEIGGKGTVQVLQRGAAEAVLTQTNQLLRAYDRLRVGKDSSAAILIGTRDVMRFNAMTEIEILPTENADEHSFSLLRGVLSFFHRGQPGRIRMISSGGTAGIRGTEFVMSVLPVNGVDQTTISMLDGQVDFANVGGKLTLTNGQEAVSTPGTAPTHTSGFIANNVLQWCFYYPGILDANDLTTGNGKISTESLTAFRAGDLPGALAAISENFVPASNEERIYFATLLLNNGQVMRAEKELAELAAPSEKIQRLASALQLLMAAVKREPAASVPEPQLATEFLAASYYAQSRADAKALTSALQLAQKSVAISPEFGFGWARVAELEFSFGRIDRAEEALNRALKYSPKNAQAMALKGFLLAAKNRTREAREQFDRALAVDGSLGNAWLGRGLCRIRSGDRNGGREDLLVAAAMEPNRATLRSYLGKAFGDGGDATHAMHELTLAKNLDPHDPTAWLYSALLNEQNNRVNEAVRDLEKSQELNNNRGVYRSRELLDQDRAVRSANLARIYAEAGLANYALQEAGASVANNYGDFGSHLFLANAYRQQTPAGPFGRRFETPAFAENLVTALLGPPNANMIAPAVSQQEFTRLFERDGAHFNSETEYLSRGAWSQNAAQYGTFGGTSYAVEAEYANDPGQARNADLEFHYFSAKLKHQLTPKDSIFFQVYESAWQGGDLAQHYNPAATSRTFRYKEEQFPNVLLGYHHEWSADSHTLFLASRFEDRANFFDPHGPVVLINVDANQQPTEAVATDLTRHLERHLITHNFEVQQVQKISDHTLVAGLRVQLNDEENVSRDVATVDNDVGFFVPSPFSFPVQNPEVSTERATVYLSDFWRVNRQLLLFGGVDVEYLSLARNLRSPPLSTSRVITHPISPKAGLLWQPNRRFDFSLSYAESVTGQDLDQSLRLEPTEFSGFPQTFRTAFPDSLINDLPGQTIAIWQAAARARLNHDFYATLALQHLTSKAANEVGSYSIPDYLNVATPVATLTRNRVDYQEDSMQVSLRKLFSRHFSAGLQYEVSHANLRQSYLLPIEFDAPSHRSSTYSGILHSLKWDVLANLPNGLFAGADAVWRQQADLSDTHLGAISGDNFWQVDLFAGYRSPLRHFEVRAAMLNVTGAGYRLNPINSYPDLPRSPTLALSVKINF